MEEAGPGAGSSLARTPSDGAIDLDLLDQLLSADAWLELNNSPSNSQTAPFRAANSLNSLSFSPLLDATNSSSADPMLQAAVSQDETQTSVVLSTTPAQFSELSNRNTGSWWIQPSSSSMSSVTQRFAQALGYIRETQTDGDVLVQLWVPVRLENRLVLTTCGQPFALDHTCEKLIRYREVSARYRFSAEVYSDNALGLPGRVFLGRLPEWSPDVRYLTSREYPRLAHAQHIDVHGTVALPVFEQGSHSCLGVN